MVTVSVDNKRANAVFLILELASTAGFRALADRAETLAEFEDVLEWAATMKLLPPPQRRLLAALDDDERARIHRRVVAFRDAAQSLFSRLARHRPPSKDDVILVSDEVRSALASRELEIYKGTIRWIVPSGDPEIVLFGQLGASAAALLDSDDLGRLRECSARDCSRLFIDGSRNGSRRWCSMQGCGNRAKARRHYKRKRSSQEPGR